MKNMGTGKDGRVEKEEEKMMRELHVGKDCEKGGVKMTKSLAKSGGAVYEAKGPLVLLHAEDSRRFHAYMCSPQIPAGDSHLCWKLSTLEYLQQ
jgi:hypothetical protein